MRYFIAGGAGFIGSHMVDALVDQHPVKVYDNLSSGSLDFLAHHQGKANLEFVQGEVGDLEALTSAMAGAECVILFAANPDIARGAVETDLDLKEGTLLTYNVLEAMRRLGVGSIIYTSGSGIYGDVGTTPTPEEFGPLLPISFYGASKLACEGLISAFCFQYGIKGHICRMANVVGRRQTHGVGFDFINKLRRDPTRLEILGDGTQSKSYIHVTDVVRALLFDAGTQPGAVSVFNVSTDDYIDVTSIAEMTIAEMGLSGVRLEYTGGERGWQGDVPKVRLPADKLRGLGWSPGMGSREAIRRSLREMLGKE